MSRGGVNNLIIPTSEQAREYGSRGGKKRAENQRKKKELKACLEALLEAEFEDKEGNKLSGAEMLSVELFKKAMSGDVRAFEVLRDTAGQRCPDLIQQTTTTVDMSGFTTEQIKQMLDEEV